MRRVLRIVAGIAGRGPRPAVLRRTVAGRVVLVTGASEGIGAATARRLGAAGAVVLLVARSTDRLERVGSQIEAAGGTAFVHPCDLSDPIAAHNLAAQLLRQHGRVDVVVSNAGRSIHRSVAQTADRVHDIQRTSALNYVGPVALLLGLLPAMRAAGHGHIVNVSSASLASYAPGWSAYLASKAAFDYWLRCAAPELRLDGVSVSTVYFGMVRTRMSAPTLARRRVPSASADEAAAMVCRAIAHRPRTVWPWWARLPQPVAVAVPATLERLYAAYLRLAPWLEALRAVHRTGLLRGRALVRAVGAARFGGTLDAALAAGPGSGIAVVDRAGALAVPDLEAAVDATARHLASLAAAGRVGLAGAADRGFVIAAIALGRLGVDTVLIPPDTPAATLPGLLAAHRVDVIVHDGRYDGVPVPSHRWHASPPGPGTSRVGRLPRRRWRGRRGSLVALTSGSTGAPKAVRRELPLRTLIGTVGTHLRLIPLRPGIPFVLAAPPHHGYGLSYVAAGLALGAPIVLASDRTPDEVLDLVDEYAAKVLVALPVQLHRLPAPGRQAPATLQAIVSGAAPLTAELHETLTRAFGDIVYNLYGTTEAGWAAIATPADLAGAPGTVGRPPVGIRLRVRGLEGEPLPPGAVGEVHVSGWLRGGRELATGDLGYLDPTGRLTLSGRVDTMIVSGGVNVYPESVAAVLAEHPAIAAVDVSMVEDVEFGQRLAARVQRRPGARLSVDELRAWQRERLPPAQRIRDISMMDDPDGERRTRGQSVQESDTPARERPRAPS
jgi:short-subunit dehydrogenase/acyl-CoA synthetase (AMP-forming)/AMP-acid ligase II